MKRLTLALCLATAIGSAQAQTALSLLTPSPIGVVLTVGRWIVIEDRPVYYIEVTGQGATAEQARLNGFRLAVEQAVGSVIASETEANNSRLKRDEIISYASGYVSKFEITDTANTGDQVQLKMKVWVGRSAIANRLLGESKRAGEIDGANASAALETSKYERAQGDRLIQTVLNDYPRRAFEVSVQTSRVSMDQYRNGRLSIPFQVRWDYNYLNSLWTALGATAQPKARGQNIIRMSTKTWAGELQTSDEYRIRQLAQALVGSGPSVQLTVRSLTGQIMHRRCYNWAELDHDIRYQYPRAFFVDFPNTTQANINGRAVLDSKIDLPVSSQQLENLGNFELAVVRKQDCR